MNRWKLVVLLLSSIAIGSYGCASAGRNEHAGGPRLFDDLGTHSRPIAGLTPEAQRWFDQGLTWAYAFNHDEAIRSFEQAARLAPAHPMPWWGVALCNGPHINNPFVPPDRAQAAWDALQQALSRVDAASPADQALIRALANRYAMPQPTNRRPLDEAYADAMRSVWRRFPDDMDVGTLTAESLMDLQPWDLWDAEGAPKGATEEILQALERVLSRAPDHPGANHLYIHAVEASPHPERGIAAADRLRTLVPASGHLVHMPSHIDVQTGRWALAADQNVQAAEADRRYRARRSTIGFYRLYMAHNHHFLAFASMMEGRSETALNAARQMIADVPDDFIRESAAIIDPVMAIEIDVLRRFGRWEELLKLPAPRPELPIATAMWRFSRGVAHAARGDVADAEREQAEFRAAAAAVPSGAMMAINPASEILAIADDMLSGEIAFRRSDVNAAVASLTRAVEREDKLLYMEPPDWIQPVRHTLGAVLLASGRTDDAERVYRRDLEVWPENGWSLHGLASCLEKAGRTTEAAEVRKRFEAMWSRADVKIGSSCLCVPGITSRAGHRADEVSAGAP